MPAVTRFGGGDITHCSKPYRSGKSTDVKANGIFVSRQTDLTTVHTFPGSPCPPHQAPITTGSTTVFVNGLGLGRIGDSITGCTAVAQGSPNVFAGG